MIPYDHSVSTYKKINKAVVFGAKVEQLKVRALLQSIMLKPTNQARNVAIIMNSEVN